MRLHPGTALLALAAVLGCEPSTCEPVGPPYAFHVAMYYAGGIPDLNVVVSSASGDYYLPNLDPPGTAGYLVRLDVEWGGAEPDGSVGTFEASAWGSTQVERVLTSVQDDEGCPITQYERVSLGGY